MQVKIALSPDLGITPDEFIAAWNADPDCRAAASASLDLDLPASRTFDPTIATAALIALLGFGGSIATTTLNELIKKAIERKFKAAEPAAPATVAALPAIRRQVTIQQTTSPDGAQTIIVTATEETR
jgi:hypothetical protein